MATRRTPEVEPEGVEYPLVLAAVQAIEQSDSDLLEAIAQTPGDPADVAAELDRSGVGLAELVAILQRRRP
jgi:hypothetical protein